MIGIKRSVIMLATGAALALSGSLGASAAPAVSPSTALTATGDDGVTLVGKRDHRHGHRHGGHGGSALWFGAPFLAAPFLYDGYGDYGYSGYGYRGDGYRNSCYRACRYENGPRYCRYNWENYC